MYVVKIEVRPASALGAAGKSAWVPMRGALEVCFYATGTDAGTLSAMAAEVCSGDGVTPVLPNAAGAGFGSANFALQVAGLVTANDMSTSRGGVRLIVFPSNVSQPVIAGDFIRATYTPTTSVAGFRVVAEVYFHDERSAQFSGGALGMVAYGTSS